MGYIFVWFCCIAASAILWPNAYNPVRQRQTKRPQIIKILTQFLDETQQIRSARAEQSDALGNKAWKMAECGRRAQQQYCGDKALARSLTLGHTQSSLIATFTILYRNKLQPPNNNVYICAYSKRHTKQIFNRPRSARGDDRGGRLCVRQRFQRPQSQFSPAGDALGTTLLQLRPQGRAAAPPPAADTQPVVAWRDRDSISTRGVQFSDADFSCYCIKWINARAVNERASECEFTSSFSDMQLLFWSIIVHEQQSPNVDSKINAAGAEIAGKVENSEEYYMRLTRIKFIRMGWWNQGFLKPLKTQGTQKSLLEEVNCIPNSKQLY